MTHDLAAATVGLPGNANTYYLEVAALTQKVNATTQTAEAAGEPPIFPNVPADAVWVPVAVFFIIFISTFGVLITGKIFNWKRAVGAMAVALMLSAIPFINTALRQGGVSTRSNAGSEEVPRNIRVERQNAATATVSWTTDKDSIGAVKYGPAPLAEDASVLVADAGQKTGTHTVIITGLVPEREYEFEIYSGTLWYDNAGTSLKFKAGLK